MSAFRDNIFSLFVKFDTISQTLSERSLDNILLRVAFGLFIEKGGKPISNKEIKNRLDPLMGGDVDIRRVDDSIKKQKKRFIPCGNNRYSLSDLASTELNDAEEQSIKTHLHIVNKYFNGATTSKEILIEWFKSVLSDFFVMHFAEYSQDLRFDKKSEEYQNDIESIITKSFENDKIEKGKEQAYLRKGFKLFFEDRNDQQNNLLFLNYGVTCFAALMANATMFADQFSSTALANTTFVLDTNVLYTINLGDTFEEETILRLENTLRELNVSLIYLLPTKQEYCRVADSSYEYLQGHAHNLGNLDFSTQINDAAIRFGCYDKDSLDQFFTAHVNNLPLYLFNSLPIKIDDSRELIEFLNNPENLKEVERKYREILKKRQSTKKEKPIIHDIAILSYVYFMRQQQNRYTILTNDSSLQEYATTYPIRDEGATALGVDTLIAILSINNAGVGNKGYEVLFKELVNLNFKPIDDDIRDTDLYILNSLLTKIADINEEKGEELQQEVFKLRSKNAPFEQIHLLLARELKIQERNQSKEIEEYKARNADQKRRIEEIEPAIAYIKGRIRSRRVVLRWIMRIVEICFIVGGIIGMIYKFFEVKEWTCTEIFKMAGFILSSISGFVLSTWKLEEKISLLSLDDNELEKVAIKKIRINKSR